MPFVTRGDAELYYEVHGSGFPVLALAPGGMRSSAPYWPNMTWDPVAQLADKYQVIVMDQRNAGQSTAPVSGSDGWADYTADQLAVLDHLGVDRFHVAGMCIGGSFIMGLIEAAPERVASAVMLQPIGHDDNRETFRDMFDGWADEVKPGHPAVDDDDWTSFRANLFSGDFLFNVDEDFVAACQVPLLVLMGTDIYHPEVTSRRVAELAPNATLIEKWKEPEHQAAAAASVRDFLQRHTP